MNLAKSAIQDKLSAFQASITFDKKLHKYFVDGVEFKSVTSRIADFKKPTDFSEIADRSAVNVDSKYFGMRSDEIKTLWEENGQKAREVGIIVHKLAELISANKMVNHLLKMPSRPSINNYHDMIRLFFHETESDVVGAEIIIFDSLHKTAGTVDLLTFNASDNSVDIWDWKTGNDIYLDNKFNNFLLPPLNGVPDTKFGTYSLQLSTYKVMLELLGIKVKGIKLIHLSEFDYKIIDCLNLEKEARMMLESNI
jgi:hypothetical protein